jgi:cyclase
VERLANLDALPHPTGFRISCFPVKITNAGAAWARAVAWLDE